MVSVLDHGFWLQLLQTKDYKIGFCSSPLSTRHEGARTKNGRLWIEIMSEWSDMSTRELLFQFASTIKIHQVLIYCKTDIIIISSKCHLFLPWYSQIIAYLALNNNHYLFRYVLYLYQFHQISMYLWGHRGHDHMVVAVCEISGRPIDNVYVKSNWFMSNFQNFVYNVQWGLCKIEIGLWYRKI